jgi:CRP-like cAMP-binding protein
MPVSVLKCAYSWATLRKGPRCHGLFRRPAFRLEVITTHNNVASHALDNRLLSALPHDVQHAVAGRLDRVRLTRGETLGEPGEPISQIYFPIDAIISVLSVMRDGTQIEVLTVGREGLSGAQALLDGGAVREAMWCQVAGEAYRMDAADFQQLCRDEPAFRLMIERYLSALIDAMAQSIACNRLHYVSQRTARWLLHINDGVGRPDFPLTHEILATMLGVRRAGISIAAAELQAAGFIRYVRGKFTVTNRAGLETAACECYAAITGAYERRLLKTG